MFQPDAITPIIVKVVDQPTEQIGVGDVLIKSFGIVGIIVLGALVCGLVLGGLFVLVKLWLPHNPLNGQVSHSYFNLSSPPDTPEPPDQV